MLAGLLIRVAHPQTCDVDVDVVHFQSQRLFHLETDNIGYALCH